MINSNPETLSTDFDIADRLYFEPMNIENVMNIVEKEKTIRCYGSVWRTNSDKLGNET
ncbi:MAG: hypothetical protein L6V95_14875 [Candidatus Melainabacteria bacterium]|nr:MAG: hypothetical protein L6V95_14875 [Candidatus Melainabacteria bacterium]